jgi:plastocyanin
VKKAATIFVAGAMAAFGVAACGSSDDNNDTTAASTTATGAATTPSGTTSTIDITADASGALRFDQSNINAKAGTATVDFDNPAPLAHDVVLDDSSGAEVGRTDLITQNKASFTATLKPGTYTFFCDVPGHEQAGMKGTITVK